MTLNSLSNLAALASHAPSRQDLLHYIGLERRRSAGLRAASCASWFGIGMAVGGGLAMLFTPRTGPEMRERLGDRAKRAREYVASGNGGARESSRPGAPHSTSPSSPRMSP